MVCHTAVFLEFSATTPAYHAVSPTVAAIFISRLCVALPATASGSRARGDVRPGGWARENDAHVQIREAKNVNNIILSLHTMKELFCINLILLNIFPEDLISDAFLK